MPLSSRVMNLLRVLGVSVGAVMELTDVLWSDWGKPERIAETLRRIDRRPAFPLTCLDRPFVPLPMTAAEAELPMSV